MEKFKFLPKRKISKLPKTAGVYAFLKGRKFLYIGKAQNIRDRVKQHKDVLGLAEHIAYIKTDSEIEALILEAKLIRKLQPKFNVMWRDDKNYFYICITKEDFPRVFITHQPDRGRASVAGPFVDGAALKQALKFLRRVLPYKTCKKMPKKPCLWYQLDRCPAPCLVTPQVPRFKEKMNPVRKNKVHKIKKIKSLKCLPSELSNGVKEGCRRNAKNLMKILQGKKNQVLNNLKREMTKLAKEEKFEEAEKIKNQIGALEKVMSHARLSFAEQNFGGHARITYRRAEAYDISNIQGQTATGSMVVFINGKPDKNQYRKFKIRMEQKPNDVAMLKEVLSRRFKHKEWPYPDLILIDGGKAQLNAAKEICSGLNLGQIKVMALAKKENKLFIEGKRKPVLLKKKPREIFNLILQLRDEAHRFARKYHHQLRKKHLLE